MVVRDTMTESRAEKDITVKVDALSYGPHGIGRKDGQAVFIPLTAPGDEAVIRIVSEKGNYSIGELSRLLEPSPLRQPPPCPYFGQCGGCPWQHIQYREQLVAKEKSVEEALRRIGKLGGFELLPIIASPNEYHYRRRIRLQVDERKKVGFHRALSHELIEIESCLIADADLDRRLSGVREWVGGLRTRIHQVEMVQSDEGAAVVFAGKAEGGFAPEDDSRNLHFLEEHKEITGLVLYGKGWRRSWGQGTILIHSGDGLRFELDAELFTQVNREGNKEITRELLGWGEFHNRDRLLELYCGAGNFTLPLARLAGEVVAVEGNRRSIENGRVNSRLNALENIRWIYSDVAKWAKLLRGKKDRFSKIILNPPRSGAKGVELNLAPLKVEKILYLSCNPTTLARDLSQLAMNGYRLKRVRPIDLYPHTFHVEALAEMVR